MKALQMGGGGKEYTYSANVTVPISFARLLISLSTEYLLLDYKIVL